MTGFSKCGISLMLPTRVGTMLGCPPGRGSKNDDCRNSASFIWFSGAMLNSFGSVPWPQGFDVKTTQNDVKTTQNDSERLKMHQRIANFTSSGSRNISLTSATNV